MINLGFNSGKDAPNVRYYPTLIDRILELIVVCINITMWVAFFLLHNKINLSTETAVLGTILSILMGSIAYFPIRYFNFPINITQQNVAIQYTLAVRYVRILNIIYTTMLASSIFLTYYHWCNIVNKVCTLVMVISIVCYFILVIRHK